MSDGGGEHFQKSVGSYNAQATGQGRAEVHHHQHFASAAPFEVEAETLKAARTALATMPTEEPPSGEEQSLPPTSRMPWDRNPTVVGRERQLLDLAKAIKEQGQAGLVQDRPALAGQGGVGKTQLAAEFAHRYGRFFHGGVFWLNMENPDDVPGEVADCALSLLSPDRAAEFAKRPQDEWLRLVGSAWKSDLPRLLIFDNCDDEDLLHAWLPEGGGCRVLVASRREAWPAHDRQQTIRVDTLDRKASIDLLQQYRKDLDKGDPDLDAIAAELGDLPLALHLAGSFMGMYPFDEVGDPACYLASLREMGPLHHESLQAGERSPTGHDQNVWRTFRVSLDRLDPENNIPDAVACMILACAAWFVGGEPIPRGLLRDAVGVEDARLFADGVRRLRNLGLISEHSHNNVEPGALQMHRLVSDFAKCESEGKEFARDEVERACFFHVQKLNRGREVLNEFVEMHLRFIAENASEYSSHDKAGGLFHEFGFHMQDRGRFDIAIKYYERSLSHFEMGHGQDCSGISVILNDLATAYLSKNYIENAENILKRAIYLEEKQDNAGNEVLWAIYNTLCGILIEKGELENAKFYAKRALNDQEQKEYKNKCETAALINNIGKIYSVKEQFDDAYYYYKMALDKAREACGCEHYYTARSLNNVGFIFRQYGKYDEALEYYIEAFEIDRRRNGDDTIDVATDLINIGSIHYLKGDVEKAYESACKAYDIYKRFYGEGHPRTEIARSNLENAKRHK